MQDQHTDECGVCGGEKRLLDCADVCGGDCRRLRALRGGTTGITAAVDDGDGGDIPISRFRSDQGAASSQWTNVDLRAIFGGSRFRSCCSKRRLCSPITTSNRSATRGHGRPPGANGTGAVESRTARATRPHPMVYFSTSRTIGSDSYTVTLPWLDIRATGTPLLSDDSSAPVNLPFAYASTTYSRKVSANGLIAQRPVRRFEHPSPEHRAARSSRPSGTISIRRSAAAFATNSWMGRASKIATVVRRSRIDTCKCAGGTRGRARRRPRRNGECPAALTRRVPAAWAGAPGATPRSGHLPDRSRHARRCAVPETPSRKTRSTCRPTAAS